MAAVQTGADTDLAINALRMLSVDAVQQANSGHPGLPMGAAAMGFTLWTRFLRHNPANPAWPDRDRFVLSAGHGSMLLYSLLHLTGYALPLDELKRFRQWGSRTPGHPERGLTPGVEVTTGPLGQGFGNAVGLAIAEAHLAARFNRPGFDVVDHYTYALVSDGDLMEGVAAEAASLAGHLRLGKLICLYDDNQITLAGAVHVASTEDVGARFEAYGWHTRLVMDGNDVEEIAAALAAARERRDRPSLLLVRTHIGYGSPHKQDSFQAHGNPLGPDEVRATKQALGWPDAEPFYLPEAAVALFREALQRGADAEAAWKSLMERYAVEHPDLAAELGAMLRGELPSAWDQDLPVWKADDKPIATRVAAGQALNALAGRVPSLIGGSADLNPSTNTALKNEGDFQHPEVAGAGSQGAVGGVWGYAGRNIHFGVREHAMGAIANGIAAHGGLLPFTATFLTFSDYMKPAIRLGALSDLHVVYVFTHDSVGLGEDGPTHQAVEHLAGLRAIPRLYLFRPADGNEAAAAWRVAVARPGAYAFALSRQNVTHLEGTASPANGVARGGYILAGAPDETPDAILIGTGSEVALCMSARERLRSFGIEARVVSLPCWRLFDEQDEGYREAVLPRAVSARVTVEAASPLGWERYSGARGVILGIDRFGASAPGDTVMKELGFTAERVTAAVLRLLGRADEAAEVEASSPDGESNVQPTKPSEGHS